MTTSTVAACACRFYAGLRSTCPAAPSAVPPGRADEPTGGGLPAIVRNGSVAQLVGAGEYGEILLYALDATPDDAHTLRHDHHFPYLTFDFDAGETTSPVYAAKMRTR
ncbi:hypothetical protein [Arthrobacter sp. CP30]